jgi:hypothetical protein
MTGGATDGTVERQNRIIEKLLTQLFGRYRIGQLKSQAAKDKR